LARFRELYSTPALTALPPRIIERFASLAEAGRAGDPNNGAVQRILMRNPAVVALKAQLAAVDFDANNGGVRNYRAGALPFDGPAGDARFLQLLSCCYGSKLVKDCLETTVNAVFTYYEKQEPNDACLQQIVGGIDDEFRVAAAQGDCDALQAAYNAQPGLQAGGNRRSRRNRKHRRGTR
jgi:hypothetical protein